MRVSTRWWVPALVAGLVLFGSGFASGRAVDDAAEPVPGSEADLSREFDTGAPDESDLETPREVETSRSNGGRYPRTEEGAVAAATAYALALDAPAMFDERRRTELLAEFATQEGRDELDSIFAQLVDDLAFRFALTPDVLSDDTFVWRAVPAGWQLRSYDGERVVVAIWATGVAIARGRSLVAPGWGTTEVELVWERGTWRLAGMYSEPGPEPPLVGDEVDGVAAARSMNAFEQFVYLPASEAVPIDAPS